MGSAGGVACLVDLVWVVHAQCRQLVTGVGASIETLELGVAVKAVPYRQAKRQHTNLPVLAISDDLDLLGALAAATVPSAPLGKCQPPKHSQSKRNTMKSNMATYSTPKHMSVNSCSSLAKRFSHLECSCRRIATVRPPTAASTAYSTPTNA